MPVDLKGNTNFACLKNLQDEYIVPRTNLAAVDINVANGLAITGNTMYVNLATSDDLAYGTVGQLVDAAVLKPVLDAKQPVFTVGDLLENTSGTLNRKRYMNIVQEANIPTRSVTPIGSTVARTALVLEPGNAYKITATSTSKWLATTAAFKAEQNTWGLEGHIELFVAGTGYVHTDDNVVLATPLEPDAVNNCTVRFHDGKAIISVEDTIAGYIVVTATGSSNGSLAYGLANNVGEYISFNDTLAGTTIDLAGATTYNGEKHVVGNGYTDTVVSGSINCTNKTTFSHIGMNGVSVTGGTLTLGDAFIPSGSTVAVSGGGLAIEKVTGDGTGVIDLNLTLGGIAAVNRAVVSASGVIITGGTANNSQFGGAFHVTVGGKLTLDGCHVSGNLGVGDNPNFGPGGYVFNPGSVLVLRDCHYEADQYIRVGGSANIKLEGTNKFLAKIQQSDVSTGATAIVTLTRGSVLDLTENPNDYAVYAGSAGSIVFEQGGATVKVGDSTASSSYMMDNVTLPAGAKLTNTAVVNLGGSNVVVSSGAVARASGCTLTNGSGRGGAFRVTINGRLSASQCVISGNVGTSRGGGVYVYAGKATFDGCNISGNTVTDGVACDLYLETYTGYDQNVTVQNCQLGIAYLTGGTRLTLAGSNTFDLIYARPAFDGSGTVIISSGASINLTSSIAPGGGIVVSGGCTVNGASITGGTYTAITSVGGSASATI